VVAPVLLLLSFANVILYRSIYFSKIVELFSITADRVLTKELFCGTIRLQIVLSTHLFQERIQFMISQLPFPVKAEDLALLQRVPQLSRTAKEVADRLPMYAEMMKDLERSQGRYIEVLLQNHESRGMSSQEYARVRKSQREIYSYLLRRKFDLVVVEGLYDDVLSLESIRAAVLTHAKDSGETLTERRIDETISSMLHLYGGLQYMVRYPDRHVMGAEEQWMNLLMDDLLPILDGPLTVAVQKSDLRRISIDLRIARSIVPMCRTLSMMRQRNYATAALIIGAAHRPEIAQMAVTYGISLEFHDFYNLR
jgi:hypothetical protein